MSSPLLKDISLLRTVELKPAKPMTVTAAASIDRRALIGTYNRLGGLMDAVSAQIKVETAAVLALWTVESSGRAQTPGEATLRFECNLLFQSWGAKNPAAYDLQFRHGGRNGQPGRPWENHQFREDPTGSFEDVHKGQASEHRALALGCRLAGDEVALKCASIGGPQIVMENAAMLGYATAQAMFDAFESGERAQVLAFFDYCARKPAPKRGDLIAYLAAKDWRKFAYYYNGPGQAEEYGAKIAAQYEKVPRG